MKNNKRTIIAVVLAIVVGTLALPFVFSDLGPDEGIALRMASAGSIFFFGGVLVGWVAIRRWLVSALCAWSPLGMGLMMLISKLTVQGGGTSWAAITVFLVAPLAFSVIGGYIGYRFKGRFRNQ